MYPVRATGRLSNHPLWTQSNLAAARGIYRNAGFKVVHRERHKNFGYKPVSETWERTL